MHAKEVDLYHAFGIAAYADGGRHSCKSMSAVGVSDSHKVASHEPKREFVQSITAKQKVINTTVS